MGAASPVFFLFKIYLLFGFESVLLPVNFHFYCILFIYFVVVVAFLSSVSNSVFCSILGSPLGSCQFCIKFQNFFLPFLLLPAEILLSLLFYHVFTESSYVCFVVVIASFKFICLFVSARQRNFSSTF